MMSIASLTETALPVVLALSLLCGSLQTGKEEGCIPAIQSGAAVDEKAAPSPSTANSALVSSIIDRARETLTYVSSLIPRIPESQSRIIAYTALAEAIWPCDHQRGRAAFRSAWETLNAFPVRSPSQDKNTNRDRRERGQWQRRMRERLLQRIAQLDPEFAHTLAEESADASSVLTTSSPPPGEEARFIFARAFELLDADPSQAARLAESTLTEGISPWLAPFLIELRAQAPMLADRLFDQALNAILARNQQLSVLTLHALGAYILQAPDGGNPMLARRFLTLIAAALEAQSDPGLPIGDRLSYAEQSYLVQLYLPLFQRYTPDLVPLMERVLTHLSALQTAHRGASPSASPQNGNGGRPLNSTQQPSVTGNEVGGLKRLGVAGGSDAEGSNVAEPSPERAILKLPDEKLRQRLLDALRYRQAQQAIEHKEFEQAERLIQRMRSPRKRFESLTRLGMALMHHKQRAHALQAFDRAYDVLAAVEDRLERATLALGLARLAVTTDCTRAFHYAQAAVLLLNQSQQIKRPNHKTGWRHRWRRQQQLHGQLTATFRPLGRAHFDQALFLATQLHNTTQRILAEIAVCQAALEHCRRTSQPPSHTSNDQP